MPLILISYFSLAPVGCVHTSVSPSPPVPTIAVSLYGGIPKLRGQVPPSCKNHSPRLPGLHTAATAPNIDSASGFMSSDAVNSFKYRQSVVRTRLFCRCQPLCYAVINLHLVQTPPPRGGPHCQISESRVSQESLKQELSNSLRRWIVQQDLNAAGLCRRPR